MKSFFICATVLILIFSAGCGETADGGDLAEDIEISDCGGFESGIVTKLPPENDEDPVAECDQLLIWKYDDSTDVLKIVNSKVQLNCCGVHDVSITLENGEYIYTMLDDQTKGNCGCDCLFDFSANISDVTENTVKLTVKLSVEIENIDLRDVWSGTLDLTKKNGTVVVRERTGDDCSYYPN